MLTTLRVRNLALVENIRVDFHPGLNIITGETGAGKSILMGALGLLLGERADKTLIRAGEDACGAEAGFTLADTAAVDTALDEFGLEPCQNGELIIRRIIKASGANQTMINDSPVTLQVLKRVGECLVDMHGPHDHQSLLHLDAQLDLLDAFGHLFGDRHECEELYGRLCEVKQRINELQGSGDDVETQIDLLSHKVREIEDAKLDPEEEARVLSEHGVIGHAHHILELAGQAAQILTESETSVYDALTEVRRLLDQLKKLMPDAQGWAEELQAASVTVKELSASISSALDRIDADPGRLEWLDERISIYQKMRRKYGPEVVDVLAELEKARSRLKDLQTRGERLAALEKESVAVLADLSAAAGKLSSKRRNAAAKLAERITAELQPLGFKHGRFDIEFRSTEPRASGVDEVDFSFAPNVGEPARPLRMIASSGEISRVMLAAKAVLADHDTIPVLVFDEIDANVGGEMGHAVGMKLRGVAEHHQVICITHLPQVARCGQSHFAVTKYVRDGRTFSQVEELGPEARVEEVARMLGGRNMTDVTLTHARQMLENM